MVDFVHGRFAVQIFGEKNAFNIGRCFSDVLLVSFDIDSVSFSDYPPPLKGPQNVWNIWGKKINWNKLEIIIREARCKCC